MGALRRCLRRIARLLFRGESIFEIDGGTLYLVTLIVIATIAILMLMVTQVTIFLIYCKIKFIFWINSVLLLRRSLSIFVIATFDPNLQLFHYLQQHHNWFCATMSVVHRSLTCNISTKNKITQYVSFSERKFI